jgi:quercetin dioxygenase-like cupin family protein
VTHGSKRDSIVTPEMVDRLAHGLGSDALSPERRTSLRARVFERARSEAPERTHTRRAAENPWIEIAPGVEVRCLRADPHAGTHMSLMRMRAGGCVPGHRHEKEEEFIVLEGECLIGGHKLVAHDMHVAEAGSWHGAITTQTGVLVLLRGEYPYPAAASPR